MFEKLTKLLRGADLTRARVTEAQRVHSQAADLKSRGRIT